MPRPTPFELRVDSTTQSIHYTRVTFPNGKKVVPLVNQYIVIPFAYRRMPP